jgi:MFS family permease
LKSTEQIAAGSEFCDYTVWQALRVPAFWVFVFGTSVFNLIWSSITLFNESILNELGFQQRTAVEMMAFLTGIGLITNMVAGKLATRERSGRLLAVGLVVLAASLTMFPSIHSLGQLRMYGAAMGFVGGLVTVVHFAAWGHLFGRSHLGKIQAVAQIVSVLASALGPLLIAWCHQSMNSYFPIYYLFAVIVLLLAVAAFLVSTPPRLSYTIVDHSQSRHPYDVAIGPELDRTDSNRPQLQPAED